MATIHHLHTHRVVHLPVEHSRLAQEAERIGARLRDDRPDLYQALSRDPTWRDDIADFVADVRRDPGFAGICALLGFLAGLAVTKKSTRPLSVTSSDTPTAGRKNMETRMIRKLIKHARRWWRSSVTGRFVGKDYAAAHPETTEEERNG